MAKNIDELQIELTAKTKNLQVGLLAAQKRMSELQKQVTTLKERNAKLAKSMRGVSTQAKKTAKTSRSLKNSFNSVSKTLFSLRLGYLGATTAAALLVKQALDTAVKFDNLRLTMNAATGSVDAGARSMTKAISVAQEFGLSIEDTVKAYARLVTASRGSRIEGEATDKIFRQVSQAARVYGLGNEELTGTLRALEQMMSKGVIQMEELKNQLGDRLPGALGLAAQAMGVTRAELFKMVETGTLASDEFLPKFAQALDDATAASAEVAKNSPAAAFTRLENSIQLLEATIASSGLVDFLADVANGISYLVDTMVPLENKTELGMKRAAAEANEEIIVLAQQATDLNAKLESLKARKDALEPTSRASKRLGQQISMVGSRISALRGEMFALQETAMSVEKRLGAGGGVLAKFLELPQAAIENIDIVRKEAEKGVNKLLVTKQKEVMAYQQAQAAISESLNSQVQAMATTKERLAKAQADGDQEMVEKQQGHLDKIQAAIKLNNSELIELRKNHGIATAEIDSRIKKAELKAIKDQARERARIELDALGQLTKAEEILGGGLFKEAGGAGVAGDMLSPIQGMLDQLTEFDPTEAIDLYDNFASQLGERFALLREAVPSIFPNPEDENLRVQLLNELSKNQTAAMREAQDEQINMRSNFFAQLSGLDAQYFTNMQKWDKLTAQQRLKTTSNLFGALISISGTKSKKLLKIQATLDAASTLASAYVMAVNAAKYLPYPANIAAFATSLAMGLGAVAKLKQAYSGAGISAGGGGGAGGGAGSVSAGGGFSPNTAQVPPETQEQQDTTLRTATIRFVGEDDSMFTGERVRMLIDHINEAQKEGAALIRVE